MFRALSTTLVLAALLAGGIAHATSTEDLTSLSDREYVEYVRDRYEWLTGEGRSGHHLAKKYSHQCEGAAKPGASGDDMRACEVAQAAQDQCDRALKEGQDLLVGLQKRLGTVPPWARDAYANLEQSVGRGVPESPSKDTVRP
jgi:hypothetical protein